MQPGELIGEIGRKTARWETVPGPGSLIRHVALDADGSTVSIAFFDLDRTLLHLDDVHGPAIEKLFIEVEGVDLRETYFNGFKLGNSYREFDRLHMIYREGKSGWRDPKRYLEERGTVADGADQEAHARAAAYLTMYGTFALERLQLLLTEDPACLKAMAIDSTHRLLWHLAQIGVPLVCMTANARPFAEAVLAATGLASFFWELVTDETMVGGGKERAVLTAFTRLEATPRIAFPRNRLILVGDSLLGDLGIIERLPPEYGLWQGYLVLPNLAASETLRRLLSTDTRARHLMQTQPIELLLE